MGNIYYLMGKSSSGKDTLFKELSEQIPFLQTVTLYTTRPIRQGEQDGREYYFVEESTLESLQEEGKVIEIRAYQTVHGIWKYFTVADEQIDLQRGNYLMIGTLESYRKTRSYYGENCMVPLYVEVEDGERLLRAITREREQKVPKYAELCRRFLADTEDFAEEELKRCNITRRFQNDNKERCLEEMIEVIKHGKL